ncbi:MAG: DUF2760 domain-containing protein [Pirellulaceae bacterium]
MQLLLALRAFSRVLLDRDVARQVAEVLQGEPPARITREEAKVDPVSATQPAAKAASRSEALTLLATLQREARFVDIVKEPLADYTDAQVGAAARDVLRDCASVLDRLFDLRPLTDQEEGSAVEAPRGYDANRFRLTGKVHGEPPFQGTLVHHGWQAMRCDVPQWSGRDASAKVIAPIELEMK